MSLGYTPLYDGNGNNLIRKEVKELHRILTSDCLVWLSNSFKNDKANPGSLLMEYDHRVIDNKLIPQHIEPLDQCIMKNGVFVDLKFNAQGFPIRESAKREYEMGKNLYFLMPVDGAVAGFVADLVRAYFRCNWYPEVSFAALGVFACAEGAQKILEVSSKTAERMYSASQIRSVLAEKKLQGLEDAILDGLKEIKE